MSDRISIGQLYPAHTAPLSVRKPPVSTGADSGTKGFRDLLDEKVLKFSHHAEVRMQQRGISFKPEQINRIATAIDQAEAKGAKDSLVLFRDIAMIVNVPSRTVVTAMEGKTMLGNVFTQIDSAVVIT
ncbi:TIGR02530 family flagellar biosynthesis protein [Paenibacillus abyssi]|uniref:Flagellar protein n=1 Tax=Paenibacillus abyssi TaxID=1340531 RepID=A0A917FXH2_9BACL|nr:TIGR02530 family flagellar biosynthesis protein [Paenibacillus abyssi]GGG12366.1 flagellar protein [Paenibacillus abyssi]